MNAVRPKPLDSDAWNRGRASGLSSKRANGMIRTTRTSLSIAATLARAAAAT